MPPESHPEHVPAHGTRPLETWPLRPVVRVGDADRNGTIAALAQHLNAGRLPMEEFLHRAEAASRAAHTNELWGLTSDLPPLVGRRRGPGYVVADVFFGLFGPLAALCLFVLLLVTGAHSVGPGILLGALGGAAAFGAVVHLVHRCAGSGRHG